MNQFSDRPSVPVDTPDLDLLRKYEPVVHYHQG